MPSDSTTQDLIEAARHQARSREASRWTLEKYVHALADRLEEVVEERDRASVLLGDLVSLVGRCRVYKAYPHPGPLHELSTAMLYDRAKVWLAKNHDPEGGDADDASAEHEQPADLDVTQGESEYMVPPTCPECNYYMVVVPSRWCCEKGHPAVWKPFDSPEPSDPNIAKSGEGPIFTGPSPSDPEPEDDPWEAVEDLRRPASIGHIRRALLDLRKRVERNGLTRERIRSIEVMVDTVTKATAKILDRLTTLESHDNEKTAILLKTAAERLKDRSVRLDRIETALKDQKQDITTLWNAVFP